MRPYIPAIPEDVKFGALKYLQPKGPGEYTATFEHPDGSTFTLDIDSSTVFSGRAFFEPDARALVSFRLGSLTSNFGGNGIPGRAGQSNMALKRGLCLRHTVRASA